jgi:hypothetical protein
LLVGTGVLDAAAVAQVDRVEVGDALDARAQRGDLFFERRSHARRDGVARLRVAQQRSSCASSSRSSRRELAAERDAPADGAAHRAHHVQVVRRAVAGEAGAVALPLGHLGQLVRIRWAAPGPRRRPA